MNEHSQTKDGVRIGRVFVNIHHGAPFPLQYLVVVCTIFSSSYLHLTITLHSIYASRGSKWHARTIHHMSLPATEEDMDPQNTAIRLRRSQRVTGVRCTQT